MVDGVRRQRFEHRLVMEQVLGRPLRDDEIVHHIDEEGLHNDPSNLMIMTPAEHQNHHLSGLKWDLGVAVKMHNEGSTFYEIGAFFNVTFTAIMAAFKKRGISTIDKRWGKTKWDLEKATSLLAQGISIAAIAKDVGISAPALHKAFARRGLVPPHKNEQPLKRTDHPLKFSRP